MVTPARSGLAAGLLMICLEGPGQVLGQGSAAGGTWASAWGDSASWLEALQELAEAGSPLSAGEHQALLAGQGDVARNAAGRVAAARGDSARSPGSPGSTKRRENLALSWRAEWHPDQAATAIGRLDWLTGPLAARVRRIGPEDSGGPPGGTIWLQGETWDLAAGGIAMTHGFGLLSGAPGRAGSLGAGASLGPPRPGLHWWPYPAEGSAIMGAAGAFRTPAWTLEGAVGLAEATEKESDPPQAFLVRLGRGGHPGQHRVCILGSRVGAENGLSVSASCEGEQVHWNLEAVARAAGRGAAPTAGAAADFGARFSGLVRVEGACAWNRTESGPALGVRPPVLAGWWGHGWAMRAILLPQPRLAVKVMAAGGTGREPAPGQDRTDRRILEVEADWPLPQPWALSGRWRRQTTADWQWSERFPWQPAELLQTRETTLLSLTLAWSGPQTNASAGLRSLRAGPDPQAGSRHLLTLGGRRTLGPAWVLKGTWAAAWGDDLDLVSACSPFSGFLLPRHWGGWSSETLLGTEIAAQGWAAKIGVSRRLPAAHCPGPADLGVWVETTLSW